jgi:hypothetical protein
MKAFEKLKALAKKTLKALAKTFSTNLLNFFLKY